MVNPRERLFVYKSLLESESRFSPEIDGILFESVSSLFPPSILFLTPEDPIESACLQLERDYFLYGLVQNSPDSILGVLDGLKVRELLSRGGESAKILRVGSCMSRSISLEPDSASLKDILDRLIHGSSPYVIVVNRHGQPTRILSADVVLDFLDSRNLMSGAGADIMLDRTGS